MGSTRPNLTYVGWVGLGWIFFWPTMVGWVKKSPQPDPTQPMHTPNFCKGKMTGVRYKDNKEMTKEIGNEGKTYADESKYSIYVL